MGHHVDHHTVRIDDMEPTNPPRPPSSTGTRYFTADAIDHQVMPGQTDPQPALANFKQYMAVFHKAFPDMKVTVEDMVAEGDKVVARCHMTGTQTGDFMGAPATGKPVSIELIDIVRFTDGKCAEHWGLSDDAAMMQQLGIAPPPTPPPPAAGPAAK
jgi:steroid delta-isomerase-like uncharacterized protein